MSGRVGGRGGVRLGRFAKELILYEFAQDVTERDVTFLNAGRDLGWHNERMIDHPGEFPSATAGPGDGRQSNCPSGLDAFEHVGGIAAGTDRNCHVAFLSMGANLAGEQLVVTIIVRDTGDSGDVGCERDGWERRAIAMVAVNEL